MELRDCKFFYGGQEMSFSVFANDPCRAQYLDSISVPLTHSRVDVYQIEPGPKTRWIVIKQKDEDKDELRLFVRQGNRFMERQAQDLPKELGEEIVGRFPNLTGEFHPLLAA
mgnify:CR=1 FL=1